MSCSCIFDCSKVWIPTTFSGKRHLLQELLELINYLMDPVFCHKCSSVLGGGRWRQASTRWGHSNWLHKPFCSSTLLFTREPLKIFHPGHPHQIRALRPSKMCWWSFCLLLVNTCLWGGGGEGVQIYPPPPGAHHSWQHIEVCVQEWLNQLTSLRRSPDVTVTILQITPSFISWTNHLRQSTLVVNHSQNEPRDRNWILMRPSLIRISTEHWCHWKFSCIKTSKFTTDFTESSRPADYHCSPWCNRVKKTHRRCTSHKHTPQNFCSAWTQTRLLSIVNSIL